MSRHKTLDLGLDREPIAIIGIGCRFPGEANDPRSFWNLLANRVDAVTEIPKDRWNIEAYYHPTPGVPGKSYSRWGGFIKGIDQFEPECFGISPREAAYMDPQQRLLLEVAWEALEDAGEPVHRVAGTKTGVFIGISHTDYANIQTTYDAKQTIVAHSATGGAHCIAANRISYCLNLQGPSFAVDTACSSSLVATDLACRSIWSHESELALAGGVNIIIKPDAFIAFCAASMLSPDGRCKAFDAGANGFVRGEGAGIVVLKLLSRAVAEKDRIYALIVGSGVNQDGRTSGISLPSQAAQEALLKQLYTGPLIAPDKVGYVEAHGTGTEVGDPIEAAAIGRVLGQSRPPEKPCVIGSVKTNIGHLESAAGIAGVIKTALLLKHRQIPANLHFDNPNPRIPFEELRLRVPVCLEPWPEGAEPAIAGVNSFGFGGTNAHVVMMEYRSEAGESVPTVRDGPATAMLLPLSARSPAALQTLVHSYRDFLSRENCCAAVSLKDLCYTASVRRNHFDHRLSMVVHNEDELGEHLGAFLAGEKRPGMYTGERRHGGAPRIVFVFPGQGPQWWGMGRELLEAELVFRAKMGECDALVAKYAGWSVLEELKSDETSSRLQETAIAQPAIFSLQVALAALWKSWGIEPQAIIGHSLGEVAAAHVAGVLTIQDAARLIVQRGRTMDCPGSRGKMLAVGLSVAEAAEFISEYEDRVAIGAINSPASLTLSGDSDALGRIAESLNQRSIFCRFLRTNYAFHSPRMEPIREEFIRSVNCLQCQAPAISLISTVTGKPVETSQCDVDYWWRNIRGEVRFAAGMDCLIDGDYDVFLELSPHPVLSGSISECLQRRGHKGTVLASLRRGEKERAVMLGSLGALYALGSPLDWKKLWPGDRPCAEAPTSPWERQSHWQECEESKQTRLDSRRHPLLGRALRSADPIWEGKIHKRVLAYLPDHRVRGLIVFPAAGYVEMALGALQQVAGEGSCILEELRFQRAFFLPEGEEAPAVQLTFQPADSSFAIHSKMSAAEVSWQLHAGGYMRREPIQAPPLKLGLAEIKRNLLDEFGADECYRKFREMGLEFGASFRGIERIWRKDGEALGRVQLPESLKAEIQRYYFHPALLDSCFQVLLTAFPLETIRANKTLYLPVQIERIRAYCAPQDQLWSHGRVTQCSPRMIEGDISIYNNDGTLVAEIERFRSQAMESGRVGAPDDINGWFYQVKWRSQSLAGDHSNPRPADYIPPARDIIRSVQSEVRPIGDEFGCSATLSSAMELLERLSITYIVEGLRKLGQEFKAGNCLSLASVMARSKVAVQHERLIGRFLGALEEAGYLRKAGAVEWRVVKPPPQQEPRDLWRTAFVAYPALIGELLLIARCGSRLPSVLRGEVEAAEIIFSESFTPVAEQFYRDSPLIRHYNLAVQKVVIRALRRLSEGRPVRILELGAGTGGLTAYVLPILPPDNVEYVFSDVSPAALNRAEQKFRAHPFLSFKVLDIEKEPVEQDYKAHSFDLILTPDVLHATTKLSESLQNVRKLLSPNGQLVILEAGKRYLWRDLVFGLLEGWWNFKDFDLRPDYPLMPRDGWISLLRESGFADVHSLSLDLQGQDSDRFVVLGRSENGCRREEGYNIPVVKGEKGVWLVFSDRGGVAERLMGALRGCGSTCVEVTPGEGFQRGNGDNFQISPGSLQDMEKLLRFVVESYPSEWRGAIHLWSLDAAPAGEISGPSLRRAEALGCHSVLHFVQTLSQMNQERAARLVLVTKNAQPIANQNEPLAVAQSPLLGLGRVIANEFPDLRLKMVDLASDHSPDEINSLLAEIRSEDREREVVLRPYARFVPRLERAPQDKIPAAGQDAAVRQGKPFRLEMSTPGVMDKLTLRESRRQTPGPGQIEIEVFAAALNFRDIMKALGLYPAYGDDYLMLGDECAGKIAAVGEGVQDLKVGDDVVAIAPASFGSFAVTSAELAMRKSAHMTFEEAVTMPVAYLTAYYGMHHLARMQAGERVLIHSAAGGVGLAAVHIARHVGAEIFATAGNPEKRELLQMLGIEHVLDSRSLSFADEIMRVTGGGVDIVLNSLAGMAIPKGLSCLAPYGRFLELGKRDIYENSKIGLWAFRKNLSLFAIDLGGVIAEKPSIIKSLLGELSQHIADGAFLPLPYRVFPVSRIAEAFRYMAQARHVGKIVISMRDDTVMLNRAEGEGIHFSGDASYLITGGLGGFGLALAEWIVERGGKNLVLLGRSGAQSPEASKAVEQLQNAGARIMVAQADVSDKDQLARVLVQVEQTLPPLKGVFHAAMVMDDGILLQLNQERFRKVMAPKVEGAWNLHVETLNKPLDYFVLFSSVSSLVGNQGQGNYVAANAFLDAFAYYRRSQGLPAVTINWGQLAQVGYAARHREISELLTRRGVEGFSPKQAMEALDRILQGKHIQLGVIRADWSKLAKFSSKPPDPRLLPLIADYLVDQPEAAEKIPARERLLNAKPEERLAIVENYIRDQVARVLGTSAAKLDTRQALNEVGLDSLMAVELKNRIESDLEISLPTGKIVQGPSIESFSTTVLELLAAPDSGPTVPPISRQNFVEPRLASVEGLSDEQVDLLLKEMLGKDVSAADLARKEIPT